MNSSSALILNDRLRLNRLLVYEFSLQRISFIQVADIKGCLTYLSDNSISSFFVNIELLGDDAPLFLQKIVKQYPSLHIVILVENLQLLSADYFQKIPISGALLFDCQTFEVKVLVAQLVRLFNLENRLEHYHELSDSVFDSMHRIMCKQFNKLGTVSSLIETMHIQLQQAAMNLSVNVFISGEIGTEKHYLAKFIHQSVNNGKSLFYVFVNDTSSFSSLDFNLLHINVNCSLIDLNLFGTYYIDEITEWPLSFLEQIALYNQPHVRFIISSQYSISELKQISAGYSDFLLKSYFLYVKVPPLRDCRSIVVPYVHFLIAYYCQKHHLPKRELSSLVLQKLEVYDYPGNYLELRNLIERALMISLNEEVNESCFPPELFSGDKDYGLHLLDKKSSSDSYHLLPDMERRLIIESLEKYSYNQSAAARDLGLNRMVLVRKIKKYAIPIQK